MLSSNFTKNALDFVTGLNGTHCSEKLVHKGGKHGKWKISILYTKLQDMQTCINVAIDLSG